MVIELSPELEARIRDGVNSGIYQSERECVEQALAGFFDEQDALEEDLKVIQSDLEAGLASFERGESIDGDEAIRMLRQRHETFKALHSGSSISRD